MADKEQAEGLGRMRASIAAAARSKLHTTFTPRKLRVGGCKPYLVLCQRLIFGSLRGAKRRGNLSLLEF